jgi:hypothetical protein
LGASNSQKRARIIADTSNSLDRFSPAVRVATRRLQRRTSRSPKKSERVADGMHFVLDSECRRIQIPQKPVADRGLLLDNQFDLAHVILGLRDRAQQPQVVHAIHRYIFGMKHLSPAEEVSLEINKAGGLGRYEFFAGFNVLGEQAALPRAILFHDGGSLFWCGLAKINFQDVGKIGERRPRILDCEIVKRDQISRQLQSAAITRSSAGCCLKSINNCNCLLENDHVLLEQTRECSLQIRGSHRTEFPNQPAAMCRGCGERQHRRRSPKSSPQCHRERAARSQKPFRRQ